MQLTVMESPINKLTNQSILQGNAQVDKNNNKDGVEMIRKRLQSNLRKLEQQQSLLASNKASQFKQMKIHLLKINFQTEKIKTNSIKGLNQGYKDMHNQVSNEKPNIIRNLNFGTQIGDSKQNAFNKRSKTLYSFLQEIGEFKKSIKQIKQKFSHINPTVKKPIYSDKKERLGFEYSSQKHSYTSYKDLSNKKTYKKTHDRWRSNDKSYSYIKNRTYVEEFTIDAFDGQTYSPI